MLKTATIILFIYLVLHAVGSIGMIFTPQSFFSDRIKASEAWQNPVISKAWLGDLRDVGVLVLGVDVGLLIILFAGFKKGQKWAWWVLLPSLVASGYYLVMEIIRGNKHLIGAIIGTVLLGLALLLPIRVFFPKRPAAAHTS